MNNQEFIKELQKLNIYLTEYQLNQLNQYYKILIEENKKYNLTAITEEKDVYLKHFYDSLTIVKIIKLENQTLLDVGTGAGFPGLVLKIAFPNLNITLLDSTEKKCNFLNYVIKSLNLKKINVVNARAEEYARNNREKYDIVTSRAVAQLKHLLEYSIPLLKVNGIFISLKSNIENEITNIENYYQKLNLSNEETISFNLPNNGGYRTLYKIEKINKTNNKYPRTYSQIKNKEI